MTLRLACCAIVGASVASASEEPLRVHRMQDGRVEAALALSPEQKAAIAPDGGFDAGSAAKLLRIVVVQEDGRRGEPLFATYRLADGTLVLRPRFPLLPGLEYVVLAESADGSSIERSFRLPAKEPGEPPRVTSVFPSGDALPANCLKFYVHFSRPMREGRAIFERVHIVDDKGTVVPHPWRRTELWTDDARRLTMWVHPGRVKQGVNLREEFGPVLEPGRKYRLRITGAVLDADGTPLAETFEKSFRTTAEDRDRPSPEKWSPNRPRVGTREPLVVELDEPLDRALLMRLVSVRRQDDEEPVAGEVTIGEHETRWTFTPAAAWTAGEYRLEVDGQLEDLAGNTPLRLFDTDLREAPAAAPRLTVPIELRE